MLSSGGVIKSVLVYLNERASTEGVSGLLERILTAITTIAREENNKVSETERHTNGCHKTDYGTSGLLPDNAKPIKYEDFQRTF